MIFVTSWCKFFRATLPAGAKGRSDVTRTEPARHGAQPGGLLAPLLNNFTPLLFPPVVLCLSLTVPISVLSTLPPHLPPITRSHLPCNLDMAYAPQYHQPARGGPGLLSADADGCAGAGEICGRKGNG
jgi:hypothetical protein